MPFAHTCQSFLQLRTLKAKYKYFNPKTFRTWGQSLLIITTCVISCLNVLYIKSELYGAWCVNLHHVFPFALVELNDIYVSKTLLAACHCPLIHHRRHCKWFYSLWFWAFQPYLRRPHAHQSQWLLYCGKKKSLTFHFFLLLFFLYNFSGQCGFVNGYGQHNGRVPVQTFKAGGAFMHHCQLHLF